MLALAMDTRNYTRLEKKQNEDQQRFLHFMWSSAAPVARPRPRFKLKNMQQILRGQHNQSGCQKGILARIQENHGTGEIVFSLKNVCEFIYEILTRFNTAIRIGMIFLIDVAMSQIPAKPSILEFRNLGNS